MRQITHISPEVVKLLHHLVLQESDSYKRINLRLNSMDQQIQSPATTIRIELKFEAKDEEYKYHNARTFYNKNKIGKMKKTKIIKHVRSYSSNYKSEKFLKYLQYVPANHNCYWVIDKRSTWYSRDIHIQDDKSYIGYNHTLHMYLVN